MKKIILFLAFTFSALMINAQKAGTQPKLDANTRASKITDNMDKQLQLTADQKPKVLAINLTRAKAMDLNREKAGSNPAQFDAEKRRIMAKWDNELKAVLTPEQITKLEKIRASKKKGAESEE